MPIIHITTSQQFNKIISSQGFIVVDFYAEWCGPCRTLSPELDKLIIQYPNATILKLNADNFHDLGGKYGVSALPTVLLFNKQNVVDQVRGLDLKKITSFVIQSHNNAVPRKLIGEVTLHIYDLSNGMAAALSQSFLGEHFEAVYHTGVVVGGKEYFFGGDGISVGQPANTPFGTPIRREVLGFSEMTEDDLNAVLADLSSSFPGSSYHFLNHNCNTFSNTFSGRLLGRKNPVPSEILNQPKKFINTPFGAQIEPLINNYFNNSSGYSINNSASASTATSAKISVEPIFFKKLSVENILQKIITSHSCRSTLSDSEINEISSYISKLPEYIETDQLTQQDAKNFINLLGKISEKMPVNDSFVIIDLLRGLILTSAASSIDYPDQISLGKIVMNSMQNEATDAYKTMALRLISNSLYRETGRKFLSNPSVVSMIVNCVESLGSPAAHKTVRIAAATLAMNTLLLAPENALSQGNLKQRLRSLLKNNIDLRPEAEALC